MRLIDADAFLERMSHTDRFFGVAHVGRAVSGQDTKEEKQSGRVLLRLPQPCRQHV